MEEDINYPTQPAAEQESDPVEADKTEKDGRASAPAPGGKFNQEVLNSTWTSRILRLGYVAFIIDRRAVHGEPFVEALQQLATKVAEYESICCDDELLGFMAVDASNQPTRDMLLAACQSTVDTYCQRKLRLLDLSFPPWGGGLPWLGTLISSQISVGSPMQPQVLAKLAMLAKVASRKTLPTVTTSSPMLSPAQPSQICAPIRSQRLRMRPRALCLMCPAHPAASQSWRVSRPAPTAVGVSLPNHCLP
jgi:hypothetical protein